MQDRLDCHILHCRGRDKLFYNSLAVGRSRRHVVHESAEVIDEIVRRDNAWWWNLGAAPGCHWPHGVSVVQDPVDVCGGVGQSKVIHGGVGVSNDTLERLLRVLEVGLPLFSSPFESR